MAEQLKTYTLKYKVMDTDADYNGWMKPAALLRYAQQMATDHSVEQGMDDAFFRREGLAYLIGKQSMEFTRVPRRLEQLSFTTIPEQSRRGTNKRVTIVRDEQGREVGRVDSRWILVDTRDHHIIRRPAEMLERCFNPSVEQELPQKMPRAAQLQPVGEVVARYSMCDVNGHINNTCYLDIACDTIPAQLLGQRPVRRAAVRYHREVPLGGVMALEAGETENGWYVLGTREEHPAFEAWLGF